MGETVGASYDDFSETTINDVIGDDCSCVGEAIVEGCTDETVTTTTLKQTTTVLAGPVGSACDDGDDTTINDMIDDDCSVLVRQLLRVARRDRLQLQR